MSLPKLDIIDFDLYDYDNCPYNDTVCTIKSVKAREKAIIRKLTLMCMNLYSADSDAMKITLEIIKALEEK